VEAVRGGEGAELLGSRGLFLLRVIVSSLWRVPIEPGISRSLAIVIASLKEGKGPFPKEDWSGSSTAMRWRSPLGPIWAMVCILGPATEAVEAKWVELRLCFCFGPFPRAPRFFWPC